MPFVLCLYLRGLEIIDKTAEDIIRKLSEYYPSQKIPLNEFESEQDAASVNTRDRLSSRSKLKILLATINQTQKDYLERLSQISGKFLNTDSFSAMKTCLEERIYYSALDIAREAAVDELHYPHQQKNYQTQQKYRNSIHLLSYLLKLDNIVNVKCDRNSLEKCTSYNVCSPCQQ